MGAPSFASLLILGQAPAPQLDALHPWGPDEVLLHSLVHEALVEPARDAPGWRSDVLDTLVVEDAGVVLSLRRGLRWHDGEPVVAADVCGTLEALQEPGSTSPFAPGVKARVQGCALVDERTARVGLVEGADPVASLALPLVPAHLRPAHHGDPRMRTGVGCGPYAAQALPGGGWALEARGAAPYPSLRWVPGVPAAVAVDLVARGEALASASVAPHTVDALRREGVPLLPWDRAVGWAIAFDSSRGPWDQRGLRRGVDLLVDRDALARVLLASDEAPAWPRLSGPFPDGSPSANRAVVPTERDLPGAEALLTEAGYRRDLSQRWVDDEGAALVLRLGVPEGMGFPAEGVSRAFVGTGIELVVVPIGRHAWVQGALGGGQRGHLDALLLPRALTADPAAWFLPRAEGGWLAPFDGAVPVELAPTVRAAGTDPQSARQLHGALHDEATWLFLFEERRPSAWGRRHSPWWTSPSGWGRIDRWGPPEPLGP